MALADVSTLCRQACITFSRLPRPLVTCTRIIESLHSLESCVKFLNIYFGIIIIVVVIIIVKRIINQQTQVAASVKIKRLGVHRKVVGRSVRVVGLTWRWEWLWWW